MLFFLACLLFGYLGLHLIDELVFHKKRAILRLDRLSQLLNVVFLWILTFIAYQVTYSDGLSTFFLAMAVASLILVARQEWTEHVFDLPERGLHSVVYMMHPVVIGVLGILWFLTSGISAVTRMVLPFSVDGLRVLLLFYLGTLTLTGFYYLRQYRDTVAELPAPPKEPLSN